MLLASQDGYGRLDAFFDKIIDWLIDKSLDIGLAILFLFIGSKVVKLIVKLVRRSFNKSGIESSVAGFLVSLIKYILYAIVFIMSASIVGFQVTSLVTILGTASLAVGLALQGSLSNFAGGVLILLMKPFKVGDYIIENDKKCEGEVVSIDIFYTKLKTFDNKIVVVPNGNITANSLTNLTTEKERRIDIKVNVAYDSDVELVKNVLLDIANKCKYILKDKPVDIFVDSFENSAIVMGLRFSVKASDYWAAKWETNERIIHKFREHEIVIPYNQLDVTLSNADSK